MGTSKLPTPLGNADSVNPSSPLFLRTQLNARLPRNDLTYCRQVCFAVCWGSAEIKRASETDLRRLREFHMGQGRSSCPASSYKNGVSVLYDIDIPVALSSRARRQKLLLFSKLVIIPPSSLSEVPRLSDCPVFGSDPLLLYTDLFPKRHPERFFFQLKLQHTDKTYARIVSRFLFRNFAQQIFHPDLTMQNR